MRNHNRGDIVEIDEEGILDSGDLEFLKTLVGKKMKIFQHAEVCEGLTHYFCMINDNVVNWENGRKFPFIDADLKRVEK